MTTVDRTYRIRALEWAEANPDRMAVWKFDGQWCYGLDVPGPFATAPTHAEAIAAAQRIARGGSA